MWRGRGGVMVTVMGREEEGGEMIEMKMKMKMKSVRHCICGIMMIFFCFCYWRLLSFFSLFSLFLAICKVDD